MKSKKGLLGKLLLFLMLVMAGVLITFVYQLNLLPVKYLAIVVAVLLLLCGVVGALLWNIHKKVRFLIGLILWLLFMIVGTFAGNYVYQTRMTISGLTNAEAETSQVGIYVRADDAAQTVSEVSGYVFAVVESLDQVTTDAAIEQLSAQLGTEILTQTYTGTMDAFDALLQGDVNSVMINTAFADLAMEMEGYESLSDSIRLLDTVTVETAAVSRAENPVDADPAEKEETPVEEEEGASARDDSVLIVYLSGIDNRGGIVEKSRSDTNILLIANMEEKEALLLSTPRDFYVPLSISNGVEDKLTHAGIYGVEVSMDTLGMLYGIDVNYYLKVNFAGFTDIVDALNGITVYSDYEFTTENGYHFVEGENTVNGEEALAFARERYAFAAGDRQRGKNQMALIRGIVNKLASSEILTNYTSLLNSLSGSFDTNISYQMISEIVKEQINDLGGWNLVSYSVDGTGDSRTTYSMNANSYVMIPDENTVSYAKMLIAKIMAGESLDQDTINADVEAGVGNVLAGMVSSEEADVQDSADASEGEALDLSTEESAE